MTEGYLKNKAEQLLEKGNKIVVSGLQYVIPGSPVKILSAEEAEALKKEYEENKSSKK